MNWAIEVHPKDARMHAQRGWLLEQEGDVEGALHDYRRAIAFDPQMVALHFRRGLILLEKGQADDALADFDRELAMGSVSDTEYSNVHYCRGNAFLLLSEFHKAAEAYDLAIDYAPDDALSYLGRGVAAEYLVEHKRAIQDYSRALELDPKLDVAFLYRAEVLLALKRFEPAEADFTEALRRQVMPDRALQGRAVARYRLHRYRDALEDWNRCRSMAAPSPYVLGERSWTFMKTAFFVEAENDLRRALEIDPAYAPAKAGLAWLYATAADETQHEAKRAETALEMALAIQSESNVYSRVARQQILAAALAENGRFAEAVAAQQVVLDLEGSQARASATNQMDAYRAGRPYRDPIVTEGQ